MQRIEKHADWTTDSYGGEFGHATMKCRGCGIRTTHSVSYGPEGGSETCQRCGHNETWWR